MCARTEVKTKLTYKTTTTRKTICILKVIDKCASISYIYTGAPRKVFIWNQYLENPLPGEEFNDKVFETFTYLNKG